MASKGEPCGPILRVPCALVCASLGSFHRIAWRRIVPKERATSAIDLVAKAALQFQAQAAAARGFCTASSAAALVLQLLEYAPLYYLESGQEECVLWLFHSPNSPSMMVDGAMDGLEGTWTADAVHEAGAYAVHSAIPSASFVHSRFLRAIEAAAADAYVEHPSAEQEEAVRCHSGAFLLRRETKVEFFAHTTPNTLVIRMSTVSMPWKPLAMDYDAGSAPVARPGDTPVLLLPTLVQGTFLGASPYTPTPSAVRLADALQSFMIQANADETAYCRVRVPIQSLPEAMPVDPMDMGLELGKGTVSVTILWPAGLCLEPALRPQPANTLIPLREQSVDALLHAAQRAPPQMSIERTAPPDLLVHGYGAPLAGNELDDDVFQGIGQLTEDDFRFFDESSAAPTPCEASIIQGPGAPRIEPDAEAQSTTKELSSSPTLLPTSFPAPKFSSPVYTPFAVLPERGPRIADKYDVHGKFYTPTASRERKRTHSLDPEERRSVRRLSSSASTPQSIAFSSPSTHDSPTDSSASSDEPETPLVVRAALLHRLHTSAWTPPAEARAAALEDPASEPARLASAAMGIVQPLPSCPPLPEWNALTTPCRAEPLSPPRILVGCQRAVVEVDLGALHIWPTLGLEPIDGPKRIHVAAALVGDVDPTAVREWLVGLQRTYARLRMGELCVCDVYMLRNAQLEHTSGQPAALVDAFQAAAPADARAVLVVYAPDAERNAELGYEMWYRAHTVVPVPRLEVQPGPVQDPKRLAQQVHALYDTAARARSEARPAVALPPSFYDSCRFLRPQSALKLAQHEAPYEALQHGAVLHVAYEVRVRARGACVRLVGIDDRAQRTFLHTWTSAGSHADVVRVWEQTQSEMRASAGVAWNVVVCRAGPMPAAEVHAWERLEHTGLRDESVLDVVVSCIQAGAPLLDGGGEGGPYAVLAPERMLVAAEPPVLSLRTAYMGSRAGGDAWTVHLVLVLPVEPARRAASETYLADVVTHLGALQHITAVRWPPPSALPWHVAVLMQST